MCLITLHITVARRRELTCTTTMAPRRSCLIVAGGVVSRGLVLVPPVGLSLFVPGLVLVLAAAAVQLDRRQRCNLPL